MSGSPFKTFVKFRKIINSYEDDCKIFYPTPWDKEYLAYRTYCQDRVDEMALSAFNANIEIDEEMQSYFAHFPLYATHSYYYGDEQNYGISPEFYNDRFGYIQPGYCESSDSQEESDIEIFVRDSDIRFDLHQVDYREANYVEYEEYHNRTRCQRRRRGRRQPSLLNLGAFLSNLEPEPKILKQRKVKQLYSRKFKCVNRRSSTSVTSIKTSITSIVKSEILTVEDCHYDKTPSEDSPTFKMTYSKAIHCKSSNFRLIEKTTSNEVVTFQTTGSNDQKATEHHQNYSGFSSDNFPRLLTAPSTSKQAAEYYSTEKDCTPDQKSKKVPHRDLAESGLITASTSNAETDFNMIQIDEAARKKSKIYKTYSQAVHRNSSKTKLSSPYQNDAPAFDVTQNDNINQTSRGKHKTYSQALFCNLPKSKVIEKTVSHEKEKLHTTSIDNAFGKTATTSRTYSQVVHSNLSKSKLSKSRSSYKGVDLRKTGIENTFDQVATQEIKSYKTSYRQVVYQNMPKLSKEASTTRIDSSVDQTSTTDIRTCRTYSQVVYCTVSKSRLIKQTTSNKEVGLHTSPTDNGFDQTPTDDCITFKKFNHTVSRGVSKSDLIDVAISKKDAKKLNKNKRRKNKGANHVPTEGVKTLNEVNIDNTSTTAIQSSKKAELNEIFVDETNISKKLNQAVDNCVPETILTNQDICQSDPNIPITQLWSQIVSGSVDKTTKHKIASNTGSTPPELNKIRFSKDIVKIEINANAPISPTFEIITGEIQAISLVDDQTVTNELGSKTESKLQVNNETKCKQDIPETKKELKPSTPTWSQIVNKGKTHATRLVCGNTAKIELASNVKTINKSKYDQDKPAIKKEVKPSMPTWSKIVGGVGPNTEIKVQKTTEAKLKKKQKSSFVKLDLWSTSPCEKTVEKPLESKESLVSYADIIKMRKTCTSCVKPGPVQINTVLTPPKYTTNVDSGINRTSQVTDNSKQSKMTASLPQNANCTEGKILSKNKGKWTLIKLKHKRSKKSEK